MHKRFSAVALCLLLPALSVSAQNLVASDGSEPTSTSASHRFAEFQNRRPDLALHLSESMATGRQRDLERTNWFFRQRAYPALSVPFGAHARALTKMREARVKTSLGAATNDRIGSASQWINRGPAPIIGGQIRGSTDNPRVSGRVVDIAVDPTNVAAHWFVATAGGGVWETADAGTTWIPRTDSEISLATTTVTVAPSNPNIIYVGTRDMSGAGVGLLKSIDGGATWQLKDPSVFVNQTFFHFTTVKVHPAEPDTVLAMTSEVYNPGGVFKSTDGGTTFTNTLRGNGTALQVGSTNFNNQYAAIRNNYAGFNNAFNGIFRSSDGGNTWSIINGPWNIASEGDDIKLAMAPSDPNTVYVHIPSVGVWRTTNAWQATPTWTALPPDPSADHQFDVTMVDPNDPTTYYGLGGGDTFYRFSNNVWTSIVNSTHVDQHAMAVAGNLLLLGNDGGFWTSGDRGNTWENKNSNLATAQFYAGSFHPTIIKALGGSQDNGTELWSGTNAWQWIWAGDGGPNAFSPISPDSQWAVSSQYANIYRVTSGNTETAGVGIDTTGAAFIAPLRLAPHGNIMLLGTNRLWSSSNFFGSTTPTWTSNSPAMEAEIGAITFAESDTSSQTYAIGSGNGKLFLTTTGGKNWADIDVANAVPNRYIKALLFHPTNASTLYVALSGYDESTPGQSGHIFKTTNATAANPTWINVSPPVDLPIDALAIDPTNPNVIYGGSDLGIWHSADAGASWDFMGQATGMPNVPVFDLQFSPANGHLFAFTYGRGVFELVGIAPTAPGATTNAATGVSASGATLTGNVNDNGASTAVSFDYGLSMSYGINLAATSGAVVFAGAGKTVVTTTVSGLMCDTTYHFRVKSMNSVGTTNGGDQSFTTSACTVPSAPNLNTVTFGHGSAAISFSPTSIGGTATSFTATCTALGQTTHSASGTTSPIVVSALIGGVRYSCSVSAINSVGTSSSSSVLSGVPLKGSTISPILLLLLD